SAGDVTLLLGGNVRGVWVNGEWRGGTSAGPGFTLDAFAIPAKFAAGENRILLRVERFDRAPLLALRIVEPGYVDGIAGGISPYLTATGDGELLAGAGTPPTPALPEVRYEVIAPGGNVVATASAPRDALARFASGAWPDGPFEVRVTGQN